MFHSHSPSLQIHFDWISMISTLLLSTWCIGYQYYTNYHTKMRYLLYQCSKKATSLVILDTPSFGQITNYAKSSIEQTYLILTTFIIMNSKTKHLVLTPNIYYTLPNATWFLFWWFIKNKSNIKYKTMHWHLSRLLLFGAKPTGAPFKLASIFT